MSTTSYVHAARLEEVKEAGCLVVHVQGHTLALFKSDNEVYAVDNRCPHMGFPLNRGTVKDGILTCHWHHARFDLTSGGTFDLWADDVPAYPVQIRDGEVWVDLRRQLDPITHQCQRLQDGLESDIPLLLAKAAITSLDGNGDPVEPFRIGLDFGARYRRAGWGQGLTMLTCIMNLLPHLDTEDRPRAVYHGLCALSRDVARMPIRFAVRPLPTQTTDLATLKRWFRRFVEVRDAQGAERCIASAVRGGANHQQLADMLFAAATDHRYIEIGHIMDFTNKALEALDVAGWGEAEQVLTSLVFGYANASRMEESNAWRYPVDVVSILELAFEALPVAIESGRSQRGSWAGRDSLVAVILDDDPQAIADALLAALREGCTEDELAGTVAYAAALRIARFPTSNEFADWDTALHTFTFANAVHQGLRRITSKELVRGVFDAAMSVYFDRFLNVPATPLPEVGDVTDNPEGLLDELTSLLNRQQQVDAAGELVARYLHSEGDPEQLVRTLGRLLLREDRDFHTIQAVEASVQQYKLLRGTPAATHVLVAAARYLAAHSPTVRSQGQTFQIAQRLHGGKCLFEGEVSGPR